MKHMKKLLCLILCLLLALSAGSLLSFAEEDAGSPALRFREDGTFTILHLTDTQDDQYPAHALGSFLQQAITAAQPDLIVFTGDLVEDMRWGDPGVDDFGLWEGVVSFGLTGKDKEKTKENAFKAAQYVLDVFEANNIPFAMAQGNNDYKVGVSNDEWLALYAGCQNNRTVDMSAQSDGIDYRLPVYGADGKEVKFNIYCMDSVQDAVSAESLQWYEDEAAAQREIYGKTVPAFVFQHIPVDEVGNFFTACKWNDPGAVPYGFKCYKLTDNAHGYFQGVYQGNYSSDEFAAWKRQGDVIAAFFGHMHTEGYSGVYEDIELNLTYGCEFAKSGPYGMRVVTLHEDDLTNYENQLYTFDKDVADGGFSADPYNAPERTTKQKIKLFFKSLLSLAKSLIRKVLSV